jgi:hypothetical protein
VTPTATDLASVAQLDALLPAVASRLELVLRLRAALKGLFVTLEAAGHPPGQDLPDEVPAAVAHDRALFEGMSEVLAGEVAALAATGAVIRDIEAGVLDWPLDGGARLYACWRHGEPRVTYVHPVDAPCTARRPLSTEAPPGAGPQP